MEEELQIGSQTVRFNREKTVALYQERFVVGGADSCSCASCKNLALHRDKIYPEEFLQLLERLGADRLKEWEAFDYDPFEKPDTHLCGGWFIFCGEIIKGQDQHLQGTGRNFRYCFTSSFPNGTLPTDKKFCAVKFVVDVPWVINTERR